jgi:hypothetical protein
MSNVMHNIIQSLIVASFVDEGFKVRGCWTVNNLFNRHVTKGRFTHEPRVVTMKL